MLAFDVCEKERGPNDLRKNQWNFFRASLSLSRSLSLSLVLSQPPHVTIFITSLHLLYLQRHTNRLIEFSLSIVQSDSSAMHKIMQIHHLVFF